MRKQGSSYTRYFLAQKAKMIRKSKITLTLKYKLTTIEYRAYYSYRPHQSISILALLLSFVYRLRATVVPGVLVT